MHSQQGSATEKDPGSKVAVSQRPADNRALLQSSPQLSDFTDIGITFEGNHAAPIPKTATAGRDAGTQRRKLEPPDAPHVRKSGNNVTRTSRCRITKRLTTGTTIARRASRARRIMSGSTNAADGAPLGFEELHERLGDHIEKHQAKMDQHRSGVSGSKSG